MDLNQLNTVDDEQAIAALIRCCGSTRWASAMAAARPFSDRDALLETADRVWASLGAADWLEAFAAHPRIGAGARGDAGARTSEWSEREQAGMRSATSAVQQRLAIANREYEQRFGYIFIVCATGKTGDEMLAILENRLQHAPEIELPIAAEEQRKITRLRLARLLDAARVAPS